VWEACGAVIYCDDRHATSIINADGDTWHFGGYFDDAY
jgi:hypothetical protein